MPKQVRLKTGLVGLAHDGQAVLGALRAVGCLELVAVAGGQTTESLAKQLRVATFDDSRSLVVEQDLDLLLAAAPVYATTDTLLAAAKRRLPVWRWPPPGRTVEESSGLLDAFQAAGCPLVVGYSWPVDEIPAFLADHRTAGDEPVLWQITCLRSDARHDTWQGDRERAGGGALLHLGFDAIRLIVSVAGLPTRVFCVPSRTPKLGLPFTYDTEDSAVLTLDYDGRAVASLVVSRTHPEERLDLVAQSPRCRITLGGGSLEIRATDGPTHTLRVPDRAESLRRQLERFAHQVLAGHVVSSEPRELLAAQAVIDAAYLSARTGDAESPARFLHLAGVPEAH